MKRRPIFQTLMRRLREPRRFIQVLLGPRQVGKTTMALQAIEELKRPCHYVSADLATLQTQSWLEQQWEIARGKVGERGAVFMIDEVQKIPHWSEIVKNLWDQDTRTGCDLTLLILGSSPWLMQRGLSESLAGRFETLAITHWSFQEMRDHFGWDLEEFVYYGGYPGAAPLIGEPERWSNYINDSLIETTISRDILLMTQVNKPAMLRRLFQLGCLYSGQVLSYTKIVGQIQDGGNTTTVAHYLDLLHGASLVCGLQKYAGQPVRRKGSSPKLAVYNTALMSAQGAKSFEDARGDRAYWGRLVESAVGAHLLNGIRGTQIELSYWKEGDREVDFILHQGERIVAIEVKGGKSPLLHSGLDTFASKFHPSRVLMVGGDGIPLEEFFLTQVADLL